MAVNWRFVALMACLMIILVTALLFKEQAAQHHLKQISINQTPLRPVLTGFGSNDHLAIDTNLHCSTIPRGIRLSEQPVSKELMDRHFSHSPDWSAISDRMQSNDVIYAYDNRPHPPPGVTMFVGLGGGYLVLRGWCVVGRFGTWVE